MKINDYNQVMVSGRLTQNPEVRKTNSGVSVCDITLACNRYSKPDQNGDQRQFTTFVRATSWDRQAEYIADVMKQGDEVFLTGILEDDNFETSEGVKTHGRLKVRISEFRVIRGK